MKAFFIAICMLAISLKGFCQTCEQRETQLTQAIAGLSAGLLYNTYGIIGSIADAYVKDAYKKETVDDLMDAQKNLADNLVKMLQGLVKDSILSTETDRNYLISVISILNGLKKQAQLLQEFAQTNKQQKQEGYDDQRKKNWSALSKLMGIKE
ncbi:MAG: hypothetical protein ABJA85_02000 [Bacteroidota bacterium]